MSFIMLNTCSEWYYFQILMTLTICKCPFFAGLWLYTLANISQEAQSFIAYNIHMLARCCLSKNVHIPKFTKNKTACIHLLSPNINHRDKSVFASAPAHQVRKNDTSRNHQMHPVFIRITLKFKTVNIKQDPVIWITAYQILYVYTYFNCYKNLIN
jgi:hypothetical protein